MLPQFSAHRTILRGHALAGNVATLMFVGSNPDKRVTHISQHHQVVSTGEFRTGSAGGQITVQQFKADGVTQIGATQTITAANPSVITQMVPLGVYLHFVASGNSTLIASLEVQTRADCAWNDLPAAQFSYTVETAQTPNPDQDHTSVAVTTATTLAGLGWVRDSGTGTVLVQVNGGTVRMTLDGTTPTASFGLLVADGEKVQLSDAEIAVAQFVLASSTPILEIVGYK